MKYVNKEYNNIELGDLIKSKENGIYYIVIYEDYVFLKDSYEKLDKDYKYMILDLSTGLVVDAYVDIKYISEHYELVSKNEKLTLKY